YSPRSLEHSTSIPSPSPPLFPYTTLFRSPIGSFGGKLASLSATELAGKAIAEAIKRANIEALKVEEVYLGNVLSANLGQAPATRSEEHTSELQSRENLVCRLLLDKKKEHT